MEDTVKELRKLSERVSRLERQIRFLRMAATGFGLICVCAITMGQAMSPRRIEADELILKDPHGRVRVRLASGGLFFLDEKGVPVVGLGDKGALVLSGDAPSVQLNRNGTSELITLGANPGFYGLGIYEKQIRAGLAVMKGVPGLDLFDEKGVSRAHMWLGGDGPDLSLSNANGKASVGLNVMGDEAGLAVFDRQGKLSLTLSSIRTGPALALYDLRGEIVGLLAAHDEGSSLELSDADGYSSVVGNTRVVIPRSGLKQTTSAASLTLFDKQKKVLWSAP